MIDFRLDLGAFRQRAREIEGALDQVPFALANALNDAAKAARAHEIDTVWPQHVEVRNKSFLRAALLTEFATKRDLRVTVYDRLGRARLSQHDAGGTKKAKGKLAIPDRKVRRTSKGVSAKQRPSTLPNSFRKGDVIYQRTGRKGRSLKLMYTLKASAQQPADVPFRSEFVRIMRREVRSAFGPAMMRAMKSRR